MGIRAQFAAVAAVGAASAVGVLCAAAAARAAHFGGWALGVPAALAEDFGEGFTVRRQKVDYVLNPGC